MSPALAPPDDGSGWLTVRGGAGGTAARIADLESAAAALDRAAATLERAAWHAAELVRLVDEAAVWSPATAPAARAAAAALVSYRHGLLAKADAARWTASSLRSAAQLYARTDGDVAALLRGAGILGGAVLGEGGPLVWIAAAAAAVAAGVAVAGQLVIARALWHSPAVPPVLRRAVGSEPLMRSSGLVGSGARLLGGPGLLPGSLGLPTARTVELLTPGMASFLLGARPGRTGPVPSDPVPAAARSLGGGARVATALLGTPMSGLLVARVVPVDRPPERAPEGIGDVLQDVHTMYPDPDGSGGGAPGSVGVQCLEHADGTRSWVVTIPGTQDWSPVAGTNPLDLRTDFDVMARLPDDATELVTRAMLAAGIEPGEPVMLAGHSLGGMAAMELAKDPAFQERFTVAAVLTAGSPVGGASGGTLQPGTQALHLEHLQDYVQTVDGFANPDDPQRTTVQADLGQAPGVAGTAASRSVTMPGDAHASELYAETGRALEGSTDPSLQAFEDAAARVLGSPGTSPVTSSTTERYLGVRVP